MKICNRLLLAVISSALLALPLSCARQTRAGSGGPGQQLDDAGVVTALRGAAVISEFKGFGEITLAMAGQRVTGSIDAVRRNTGFVNAQVYTTFGSGIASIKAEDFTGRVGIDRQAFDFSYDDPMSEIPLPCASRLTYGKFISSVTGSMPDVFWQRLESPPDTLIRSRRRGTVTAVWFADTLTVRAQVLQKSGQIGTVTFNYDIGGDKFSMRFGRFKNGAPHEITVRESGRNYFTVNYESLVWQ